MRAGQRLFALVAALLFTACARTHNPPGPDVRQTLAPTGKLRVAVYPGSPTSMLRDPASGETKGVSVDLGKELADRLGVPYEQLEFRRVAEVIEALKTGAADFAISNSTPARAKDVDFSPPLLSIELGYLVPSSSPLLALTDVDRPGVRVGVTQGSTSQSSLPSLLSNAVVVPVPTLNIGIEMLSTGKLDAFATNKAILFEMSESLPGSRVLDGRWGVEQLAIAIPKGRDQGMYYVQKFIQDANSQGLITRAAERAGLRGIAKTESK